MPRWSALLFLAGNVPILLFAGTENWMTLGALAMLAGLFPLVRTPPAQFTSMNNSQP